MLVWPNIGEKKIEVHFLPGTTTEEAKTLAADMDHYLHEQYKDRYNGTLTEKADATGQKEPVYLIKGRFVQAAFINELSRRPGVDSERIDVEKLWVEKSWKAKPFKLGLDLQGGMNLLLAGDFEKLQNQLAERYPPETITNLENRIANEKNPENLEKLNAELQQIKSTLVIDEAKKKEYIIGALEIIRSRIDKTGVSDPPMRVQGNDKIEISLPGVASPEAAKKLISRTASVEYRLAEPPENGSAKYQQLAAPYFADYLKMESEAKREQFIADVEKKIKLPSGYGIYVVWEKRKDTVKQELQPVYFIILEKEIAMSGDDISPNTYVGFNEDTLQNTVNFQLTPEGGKKFGKITSENKGRQMAILIDDRVRSVAIINEPILSGSAMINGDFTVQEAKDLALIIKEGALPVPMKIVEERSVGPTLGYESIRNGILSLEIGLAIVALFMVLYYHIPGIIAVLSLILNVIFISAILALMDFTITLPGLAGIVLTVGMVVDANVIIYERIREELGRGKTLRMAVEQAFDKAAIAIRDANLTTLLAAIVLSQLGVGPIKGFAVTLLIGILASLFTALYVNKTLFMVLTHELNFQKLSFGFGKYRKIESER